MLYNIAMIQCYSRCVIRQLLWLRSTYPNVLLRLGLYMCSLQELCANWLLRPTPDSSASGAREHITRESPDNRLRHNLRGPWGTRGILMYKVFPRTCIPRNVTHMLGNGGRMGGGGEKFNTKTCEWLITQTNHSENYATLHDEVVYNIMLTDSIMWWERWTTQASTYIIATPSVILLIYDTLLLRDKS